MGGRWGFQNKNYMIVFVHTLHSEPRVKMVASRSRSRSRSRSCSRSRSRSRSRSASRSRAKKARRAPKCASRTGKRGCQVLENNISMLPKSQQMAYCGSCATRPHEKTPLVASKSQLVRMLNRNTYCIIGPCSGCGRKRSCFIKRPAGY